MATTYLPKLNPKIGGGLGGLPEPSSGGGGGGAVIEGEAILTSKPILQHLYLHRYQAYTTTGTNVNFNDSKSIVDVRNCIFDIYLGSYFAGLGAQRIIFPEINQNLTIGFLYQNYHAAVKLQSANTIRIVSNYPVRYWITVTEYDAKPLNAGKITNSDYTSGKVGTLPFEITNIKNCYVGAMAWNPGYSLGGLGMFQTSGFTDPTNEQAETMPKAAYSVGQHGVDGTLYIPDATTFETTHTMNANMLYTINEWEN